MRLVLLLLTFFLLSAAACQRRPAKLPAEMETLPTVQNTAVTQASDSVLSPLPTVQPAFQPFPRAAKENGLALPSALNSCETVGEVWNFDGLDGCGLLVQTTTGYLFAVDGLPQGYSLEAGTRIRFGFRYAEAAAAACQRQDALIRITCMQLLRQSSGFARPFVCQAFDVPTAWVSELVEDLSANYVTRFPWTDNRYVYLFETSDGQYLYDCQGLLLCQPKSNCLKFIEDFSQGKLIYEG